MAEIGEDTARFRKRVLLLLGVNAGLSAATFAVVLSFAIFAPPEPPPPEGATGAVDLGSAAPDRPADAPAGQRPSHDPLESWVLSTVAPLRRAAVDYGDDPAEVLPPESEIEAAIRSGSFDSAATVALVAKLRDAYEKYAMPFPEPAGPEQAPTLGGGDEASVVRALLKTTTDRITRAAEEAGEDPAQYLPTRSELIAAAEAGSLDAEPVRKVLMRLRAGYEHFGLAFPDPEQGGLSGRPE